MKKRTRLLTLLLALAMALALLPTAAFAADTRIVISSVAATSNWDTLAGFGKPIQTASMTQTAGAPARFALSNGGWCRKNGGSWEQVADGSFTAGQWRYETQVRIDNEGTTHKLSPSLTVTVNGDAWEVDTVQVYDTYSMVWVASPEITVEGSVALAFIDSPSFDIGTNFVGRAIGGYSVVSNVSGGTAPYTFSKVSGPAWVTVSADGTVGGTPTAIGENSDLVIRVTDAKAASREITVSVEATSMNPEDRADVAHVAATSNLETLAVLGKAIQTPGVTVTQGEPAYFSLSDGGWYKKNGESWEQISSGSFTAGVWRYETQVRIDDGGDACKLSPSLTVTVNGASWEVGTVQVYDTYSMVWVTSPEITIAQPPAPGAIASVSAKAEAGKITVSWTKSANATAYIIQRRVKDDTKWTTLKSSVTELKYVDTTGEGGTVYQYRVRGRDGSNYGPFKVSSVVRAIAGTPTPGAISSVTAKAEAGKITVSWTKSANATAYIIQRRVKDDTKWTTLKSAVAELKYEDKTGTAGTVYQYRVRGRNGTVYGPFKLSSVARFIAGVPAPGAISAVTAKAEAGKITVTWTASANAANYVVERWTGGTWSIAATLGNTLKYEDSSVTAGTQYRYRVTPKNAAGSGARTMSGYVKAVAAASTPGAIATVTAKATGENITVTWTKSAGATSYSIQRRVSGSDTWTTLNSNVTATTYVDQRCTADLVYQYRVRPKNAAGWGSYKASGTVRAPAHTATEDVVKVRSITPTKAGRGKDVTITAVVEYSLVSSAQGEVVLAVNVNEENSYRHETSQIVKKGSGTVTLTAKVKTAAGWDPAALVILHKYPMGEDGRPLQVEHISLA